MVSRSAPASVLGGTASWPSVIFGPPGGGPSNWIVSARPYSEGRPPGCPQSNPLPRGLPYQVRARDDLLGGTRSRASPHFGPPGGGPSGEAKGPPKPTRSVRSRRDGHLALRTRRDALLRVRHIFGPRGGRPSGWGPRASRLRRRPRTPLHHPKKLKSNSPDGVTGGPSSRFGACPERSRPNVCTCHAEKRWA